jgi:ferredoxin/flavodoxin---NADP+ reductase
MLNATIKEIVKITDDLIIYRILPDEGVPDFKAGQYVAIGLPESHPSRDIQIVYTETREEEKTKKEKIIKRAYSIGSTAAVKKFMEFYIAIVEKGELTSRLILLKEGDRLFMSPKVTGHFTLDPIPQEADIVMVATGTGIAPFIAMLKTESAWGNGRKITLLHGVRYNRDLAYREELLSLQAGNSRFAYKAITSREECMYDSKRGYVQQFFEQSLVAFEPSKDHIMLCGNPGMIDDIENLLKPQGYTLHTKKNPGKLHYEKYW